MLCCFNVHADQIGSAGGKILKILLRILNHQWQSKNKLFNGLKALSDVYQYNVRLSTKCPSIISMCKYFAPAWTGLTSAAKLAKSALKIDGAIITKTLQPSVYTLAFVPESFSGTIYNFHNDFKNFVPERPLEPRIRFVDADTSETTLRWVFIEILKQTRKTLFDLHSSNDEKPGVSATRWPLTSIRETFLVVCLPRLKAFEIYRPVSSFSFGSVCSAR